MGEDRTSLSGHRGRPLRALKAAALLGLGWSAGRLPEAWGDARGLATAWQRPPLAAAPTAPAQPAPPPQPVAPDTLPMAAPPAWWPWLAPVMVVQSSPPPLPPPATAGMTPEPATAGMAPESARPWPQLATETSLPAVEAGPPPASAAAHALASAAYAALAAGDRRAAERSFAAALAAGPHPNADAWARARKDLRQRWSVEAYALLRDPGPVSAAESPLLGGGQIGTTIAWKVNPLSARPLSLVLRSTAANDDPRATGQAAVGVRWQALPGVTISAERLVALGEFATNGFTGRIAAGAEGRRGRLEWQGYGEAGIIDNGDWFAGGSARLTTPLFRLGRGRWSAGGGAWGGAQSGLEAATRLDVGPTLLLRQPVGPVNLSVQAEYRWRVAGNADPGSGPAVTLATTF